MEIKQGSIIEVVEHVTNNTQTEGLWTVLLNPMLVVKEPC